MFEWGGREGLVKKRLDVQQRDMTSTTAVVKLDMDTATSVCTTCCNQTGYGT